MNSEKIDELMEVAAAVSRGEILKYEHNACFTSGAFDLLLADVRGQVYFELLSSLCGRILTLSGSDSELEGYYLLLNEVVPRTDTTQMPQGMQSIIDAHPLLSHDLRVWYRCEL